MILEAYKAGKVTADVEEKPLALVDLLRDEAKTAERLEERELAVLCGSLSGDVAAIATHYMAPSDKDIALIQKLSRAVVSAVKPRASTDQLEQENLAAALTNQ